MIFTSGDGDPAESKEKRGVKKCQLIGTSQRNRFRKKTKSTRKRRLSLHFFLLSVHNFDNIRILVLKFRASLESCAPVLSHQSSTLQRFVRTVKNWIGSSELERKNGNCKFWAESSSERQKKIRLGAVHKLRHALFRHFWFPPLVKILWRRFLSFDT